MLTLKEIACGYKDYDICKDIHLQIERGRFTSIIGPNGAGKTTLLKAIAGIVQYQGTICLENKDIKTYKRKVLGQKIALMSQQSTTYFSYSVYDTVLLGRYPYIKGILGLPNKEDQRIVLEALERVGLLAIKDKSISELSGGQLQRVFLARTLAQEPEVVLLDEPTNHLDFKHQIEILDFVKAWVKEERKIVIAVLHDLNLVQNYSERVILLSEGRVYAKGDTREVMEKEKLEAVYDIDVKTWMKNLMQLWTE